MSAAAQPIVGSDPSSSSSSRPRATTVSTFESQDEAGTPSTSITVPSAGPSSPAGPTWTQRPSSIALGKRRQDAAERDEDEDGVRREQGGQEETASRPTTARSFGPLQSPSLMASLEEETALDDSVAASPATSIRFAPSSSSPLFRLNRRRSAAFMRSAAPSPEITQSPVAPIDGDAVSALPERPAAGRSRAHSVGNMSSFPFSMPKKLRRPSFARARALDNAVQSTPTSPWASQSHLTSGTSASSSFVGTTGSNRVGKLRKFLRRQPSQQAEPIASRLVVPSPLAGTRSPSPAGSFVRPGRALLPDDALLAARSESRPSRARSQSAPLRLASTALSSRSASPMPGVDLFDLLLPRELRIYIFASLLVVYADEHAKDVAEGRWRGQVARETRWVGHAAGRRHLVAISRVSKTWQALAFDGQLWQRFDIAWLGHDLVPVDCLLRIVRNAGPFITDFNLRGTSSLQPAAFLDLIESAATYEPGLGHETGLVSLDLSGCRNLSAQALNILLNCSPHLVNLNLSGLTAVINSTCDIIGARGHRLQRLNVSRCPNIDASRLTAALTTGVPDLRQLRMARIRSFDDRSFSSLLISLHQLALLDVGFSRELTDAGFNRVASALADADDRKLALRVLVASDCRQLTGQAFKALAGSVPLLETVEMGSIGTSLRDDGLVEFFESTPLIRKVDLTHAVEISDRVISALTAPAALPLQRSKTGPGSQLEHLVISGCPHVSDRALQQLIKNNVKLRVLEVDNTNVGDQVVKDFIRAVRRRKMLDAGIVAFDARGVTARVPQTTDESILRPRFGHRGWQYRTQDYHDPPEASKDALNELDSSRIMLKTFYTLRRLDEQDRMRTRRREIGTTTEVDSVQRPIWTRRLSLSEIGERNCVVM